MKMEHVIAAQVSGSVRQITVERGDTVLEGHPLAFVEEADVGAGEAVASEDIDLDAVRPDLAEVLARKAKTLDASRPDAVARRRRTGQRTVRENVDDLVDPDSRSEEHTSELQSLMRHSYAVFCLKQKTHLRL